MPPRNSQRLELTWFNKDKALIPAERGRYGYAWVDPRDPRYCEVHTLIETETVKGTQTDKVDGVAYSDRADFTPTTDNMLINGESGDVLEALTSVPELAGKYVGKVKLCYIDPPFNTEKAFTHYEDNLEHSVWLTMMRDRLVHIKKLLAADGSIWVHLDDSENHRMRVLMDEVFGPANFVAEVVWQKADSPRSSSGGFSVDQDVILVYRKSECFSFNRLPRSEADNARFSNPDNDPNGPWWDGDPTANKGDGRGGMCYAIQNPLTGNMQYPGLGRHWSLGQGEIFNSMNEWAPYRLEDLDDAARRASIEGVPISEVKTGIKALVLDVPVETARKLVAARRTAGPLPKYLIRSKGSIGRKMYVPNTGMVPRTWWTNDQVGHNREAKTEIKTLFPRLKVFDTPKPERLLERIIHIATNPRDIVLDVFAGSGTTAAVAHKMGRSWVTCELLETNFETFTLPRLTKVVRGEDQGGITVTAGERVDAAEDGLPGGLSPEEAFGITQAFSKAAKAVTTPLDLAKVVGNAVRDDAKSDEPVLDGAEARELRRLMRKLMGSEATETDFLPHVRKAVADQLKTEMSPNTINWRGGGSFRVMRLSDDVFTYDPSMQLIMLTDHAHGETLIRSIAANLGFSRTPGKHPFHGVKGQMRLVVLEGAVTEQVIDDVLAHLPADERVTIAALSVPDGMRQYLRQRSRGSVIKHVPDDVFSFAGSTLTGTLEG